MAQKETEREPVPEQTEESPGPDSPTELQASDWKVSGVRTFKEIKDDRVTLTAGALAYNWFLAMFPSLIALIGVMTLIQLSPSTVSQLVTAIQQVLPPGAAGVLTEAVKNAQNSSSGGTVAVIVGGLIALWGATAGMVALQSGLNVAYDVPEDRKFIGARLMALWLLVLVAILGGPAAALVAFGNEIGGLVKGYVPVSPAIFDIVWDIIRYVVAVVLISILFSAIYFFGPKRESPKWQWVSLGGLVATIIWVAASLGFQFYVTSFGSYGETYGAIAGVVVLLLWLFLTGLAVLVGAELNAEVERQAARKAS